MTKAPGMGGFQSPSICLTQDAKQLTEHSAPSCGFPDTKQGNKSALQLSSVTLELLLFLLAPPAEFLNAAGSVKLGISFHVRIYLSALIGESGDGISFHQSPGLPCFCFNESL